MDERNAEVGALVTKLCQKGQLLIGDGMTPINRIVDDGYFVKLTTESGRIAIARRYTLLAALKEVDIIARKMGG